MPAETFIPSLTFSIEEGPAGARSVVLRQQSGGIEHWIELHALHVGLLARRLGVVPTVTAEAASMISASFGQATKFAGECRELRRALMRCSEMASALLNSIRATHGLGHEDLDPEIHRAQELSGFLAFLCEGFDEAEDPAGTLPTAPSPTETTSDLFAQGGCNG